MERESGKWNDYVPPRIEVFSCNGRHLMEVSGQHNPGSDDGEINGAKELSLDISFSDVWEE